MKLNIGILLVVGALLTGSAARAEIYVGGLVGYGTQSGSALNTTGGLALGATAGIQLVPNLGVAATYIHNALKSGSTDVGVSEYLVEGNFFTLIFFPSGIHVGSVSTSINGASQSDFGFGAHTGIDVPIYGNMTIGGSVYWTYVTSANDKHSLFNLLVPIKFHF